MIKKLINLLINTTRVKKIFWMFIIIGYIAGTIIGYSILKQQIVKKMYCVERVGPISCQPDEDCDKECLRYEYKFETRERESFYTYGLAGAFLGGWLAVFVVTYLLKE